MESLVFTLRLIKKRPLRSLLTLFQIALGVWIVVTILTMNMQANDRIEQATSQFGENLVRLNIQKMSTSQDGYTMYEMGSFTETDIEKLALESNNVESVFLFENQWQVTIKANQINYQLQGLTESSASAIDALGLNIVEGYGLTPQDEAQKNQIALISTELSKQLFPNQSALGQQIEIESMYQDQFTTFEVIGVFEALDPLLSMFFQETTMIIPMGSRIPSGEMDFYYRQHHSDVYIKSHPGAAMAAVEDAQLIVDLDEGFNVSPNYLSEYGSMFSTLMNQMSLILGAFAFVAIIISSIGILSIMLVNVVERTREIGLRKALGASKLSIILQVVHESAIFSLLGSIFGIIIAVFTSPWIIDNLLSSLFFESMTGLGTFHPKAALYSCLMAVILGIIFGLYPAIQAAKMPAVEALRDN